MRGSPSRSRRTGQRDEPQRGREQETAVPQARAGGGEAWQEHTLLNLNAKGKTCGA